MKKSLQYDYEYTLCRTPDRSELEVDILCLQRFLSIGTLIDQSQIERFQRFSWNIRFLDKVNVSTSPRFHHIVSTSLQLPSLADRRANFAHSILNSLLNGHFNSPKIHSEMLLIFQPDLNFWILYLLQAFIYNIIARC